jgi:hypothetical protein
MLFRTKIGGSMLHTQRYGTRKYLCFISSHTRDQNVQFYRKIYVLTQCDAYDLISD